mgnify:FL=1
MYFVAESVGKNNYSLTIITTQSFLYLDKYNDAYVNAVECRRHVDYNIL